LGDLAKRRGKEAAAIDIRKSGNGTVFKLLGTEKNVYVAGLMIHPGKYRLRFKGFLLTYEGVWVRSQGVRSYVQGVLGDTDSY